MIKFKIGDKVRALKDDNSGYPKAYVKGDILTISDCFISDINSSIYCRFKELLNRWPSHYFETYSFEIVPKILSIKDYEHMLNIEKLKYLIKTNINTYMSYNLSQEEIDQIMKEIKEEQNQLSLPNIGTTQPVIPTYKPSEYWKETMKTPEPNGNKCKCEMVQYVGLQETFNYCKHCGKKE